LKDTRGVQSYITGGDIENTPATTGNKFCLALLIERSQITFMMMQM